MRDPILRNALHLALSAVATAGLGFVFWLLAARALSPEDVGLASALVGVMLLLGLASKTGFDLTLVRVLPRERDRALTLDTFATVTVTLGLTLGALVIVAGPFVGLPFTRVLQAPVIALAFASGVAASGFLVLLEGAFVGEERAHGVTLKNLAASVLKLALLPVLVTTGALGVVLAWGVGSVIVAVALVAGGAVTAAGRKWRPRVRVDARVLKRTRRVNAGNFLVQIADAAPPWLFPIVLVHVLGAAAAGFFYVAWMIATLLYFVPVGVGLALVARASHHDAMLPDALRRAVKYTTLLVVPGTLALLVLAPVGLRVFGAAYADAATPLLRVLALATPLVSANTLLANVLRARDHAVGFTSVSGGVSFLALVLVFPLSAWGLTGVGAAWLASNALFACASVPLLYREARRMGDARVPPDARVPHARDPA